jgi:hypothetical protein
MQLRWACLRRHVPATLLFVAIAFPPTRRLNLTVKPEIAHV